VGGSGGILRGERGGMIEGKGNSGRLGISGRREVKLGLRGAVSLLRWGVGKGRVGGRRIRLQEECVSVS